MVMFYTTYIDKLGHKHHTMARWNCYIQAVEFPMRNF